MEYGVKIHVQEQKIFVILFGDIHVTCTLTVFTWL